MASTRAPAVAEVLWELKREDKIATYGAIAGRAGFSAGANGRAMITCLKTVRKDWPHLQWWRAIRDDGTCKAEGDQAIELADWGAELSNVDNEGRVHIKVDEARIMVWDEEEASAVLASNGSAAAE